MKIELRRGNDQVVTLPRLIVLETGQYLNAAIVRVTLLDGAGEALMEDAMTYVASSNGSYEWPIEGKVFMFPPSSMYQLIVEATQNDLTFRDVYDVTITD